MQLLQKILKNKPEPPNLTQQAGVPDTLHEYHILIYINLIWYESTQLHQTPHLK